eukprot:2496092-Rhodomonas_salina.2
MEEAFMCVGRGITLLQPYTLSGTELACATCIPRSYTLSGTGLACGTMRYLHNAVLCCVVLRCRTGLALSYESCGTELAYGATTGPQAETVMRRYHPRYAATPALCDARYHIPHAAASAYRMLLRLCYAMPGTDVPYAATRLQSFPWPEYRQ